MSFVAIAIGGSALIGAGVGLYEGSKQGQVANTQLGLEQDQTAKQDSAFMQLQTLLSNPNSFFQNNGVYSAAFDQGTAAVARGSAASGGNNTNAKAPQGQEAVALQTFGQSFGSQQLLGQEELLAGMSGTGFNPAAAGSSASSAYGAQGSSLNSLAGLLSFFGSSGGGGLLGGGNSTPFTPLNDSSLGGTTAGWTDLSSSAIATSGAGIGG